MPMVDPRIRILFVLPLIQFDDRFILVYALLRSLILRDPFLSPIALAIGYVYYYTYGKSKPTAYYRITLLLSLIAIASLVYSEYYRPIVIIPIFAYVPADKSEAIDSALLILLLVVGVSVILARPNKALAFIIPGISLSFVHAIGNFKHRKWSMG